jgi:hypothetical protein
MVFTPSAYLHAEVILISARKEKYSSNKVLHEYVPTIDLTTPWMIFV